MRPEKARCLEPRHTMTLTRRNGLWYIKHESAPMRSLCGEYVATPHADTKPLDEVLHIFQHRFPNANIYTHPVESYA